MKLAHVPPCPTYAAPPARKEHIHETLQAIHLSLLNPRHDEILHRHLEMIHSSGRRSKVLDVGAGTGSWAITLARRQPFADVVGIDINWDHFEGTRLAHGNADFHTVDVTLPLPWADDTFDLIHVKSMLVVVPSYADVIGRLTRLLKSDGLLVLVEPELSFVSINGTPAPSVAKWSASVRRAVAQTTVSPPSTDGSITSSDTPDAAKLDAVIAPSGQYARQFYFQEIGCPIGAYMTGASPILHSAGAALHTVIHQQMGNILEAARFDDRREELRKLLDGCVQDLRSESGRYVQRLFALYARKRR